MSGNASFRPLPHRKKHFTAFHRGINRAAHGFPGRDAKKILNIFLCFLPLKLYHRDKITSIAKKSRIGENRGKKERLSKIKPNGFPWSSSAPENAKPVFFEADKEE